ncbi:arabinan endo-1,5-alpha-L-arabinosidase [Agromyces sp. NPDC058110]|uniref:arabinan endo-1,5-alpha-L-arabinosidase n=1 Tax=Agromyces sp. NPDC058110 TaxID=3346345 RepID=UPI0036D944A5
MVGRRARLSVRVAAALAAVGLLGTLTACGAGGGVRAASGDLSAHDPALARDDAGTWWVYSTGNGTVADGNVQIRSSVDGEHWVYEGEVWSDKPEWLTEAVKGVDNLWAPELVRHDGTWYLYYSASRFGKNSSVIALATNSTLDPDDPAFEWVDQGPVIASTTSDDFNAIDPGVITDDDGTPWMAFGSFWSGIRMVELEWPSGLRTGGTAADDTTGDAEPLRLADRGAPPNAIEAPYLVEHDGAYFLFVSRDACCQGAKSTYNMAVGRADAPTGPFVDRDGVPLLDGGGTPLLATDGSRVGPGGQSVWGDSIAFHYYDADAGGAFRLAIAELEWDDEGWPVVRW